MNFRRGCIGVFVFAVAASVASGVFSPAVATSGEGGSYVPVTPTRIADTGTGVGLSSTGPISAGAERSIQVLGTAGVPVSNVSAVVVDVAAKSSANSRIIAYPTGEVSNLAMLFVGAQESWNSNTAIVRVGTNGKITIKSTAGNTNFNVDIQGYFTKTSTDDSTGGFVPIQPQRVARNDAPSVGVSGSPLQGSTAYFVQVGGQGSIPADATAVFANVRARNPSGSGGIRVAPSGTLLSGLPVAVSYNAGTDSDGGLAIPLGPDGKLKFAGSSGTTYDIIIDVQGYFTAGTDGGAFTPLVTDRIWNSAATTGALGPNEEREVQVAGVAGVPEDAGSVAMTVSVEDWTASGTLSVYNPDNEKNANGTSSVAFKAPSGGANRSSTAIVELSLSGTITVRNRSSGSVQVLLNAQGWFSQPDDVGTNLPSEADRVANEMREALASNTQLSAEDEALPAITPYDTHDLVFSTAATDTRTATLPLPTGCSVQDPVALRLSCDFGPVVISPVAVTADGNTVEVAADLDNNGLRVSPQTPEFDGFVTAYLTQAKDSDLVDDIAQTLAELVGGNGPALKTQEQLDAEEDELNGDTESTEPAPDTSPNTGASPAPSPTERSTASARASRPVFVGIPSNYIYCKTHTTARCRPEGRHDYCTDSPDYAKYARGTANFKGPCARHDMGIARIATYNLSLTSKRTQRATEDRNLKSNMRQNCLYALQGYGGYLQGCYSRASTYYWAVSRTTNGWNGR